MDNQEPTNYSNNVHFWLRKIYYFIANVADKTRVEVENGPRSSEKEPREKLETDIRQDLKEQLEGYDPSFITKEEAREACAKLYEMFNMPLDKDVLKFIEDPRCPGGRPRSKF